MNISNGNQNLWNFCSVTGYYFYEGQDFTFLRYLQLPQEGILMNNNLHRTIITSTPPFIKVPGYSSETCFSFGSFF